MCAFVQGAGVRINGDGAAVEVDVVAVRACQFAPAAAGPGGGDDQQACGLAAECGGLVGDAQDLTMLAMVVLA
jgi:hypothetical protein